MNISIKMSISHYTIDVETTGLPSKRGDPTISTIHHWDSCRLVSVAVVGYDDNCSEISSYHELIRPDGYIVGATHIHGITHEKAMKEGLEFDVIYNKLVEFFSKCRSVVGHNLSFDMGVIRAEVIRRGLDIAFLDAVDCICTLDMIKEMFCTPMKLGVAYNKLVGGNLEGAHDALVDSRATGEVYARLLYNPWVHKKLNVSKIYISVTDVASCLGKTRFNTPYDIMDKLWKKYNPGTFSGILKDDVRQSAIDSSPVTSNIINDCITNGSPMMVDKMVSDSITNNPNVPSSVKKHAAETIRRAINTRHGIDNEDKIVGNLSCVSKDDTFYTHELIEIMGTRYILCGRIDGYLNLRNSKCLVEIKNRAKGLFNKVRDYEMIQVQCYLMMTGMSRGHLVECWNDSSKTHVITSCSAMHASITLGMGYFCKALHDRMCS